MASTVSTAFKAMYFDEVKEAYQQMGTLLRPTVRLKTGVKGSTATFQKYGTGQAGLKTRHGLVPLMDPTHSTATATLEDWYAGAYSDKLDELKQAGDERTMAAHAGAWALGRKTDSLITTVLDSGAGTTDSTSTAGLTRTRILTAIETLIGNDVPFDGQVYGAIGPHQWSELMLIDEFNDADKVGYDGLPWKGGPFRGFKDWMGVKWTKHTDLPLSSGTRKCFVWHKNAVGLAEGAGISGSIDWVPERAAYFIDHMMSMGAVAIDGDGIYEIQCDDDEALSTS